MNKYIIKTLEDLGFKKSGVNYKLYCLDMCSTVELVSVRTLNNSLVVDGLGDIVFAKSVGKMLEAVAVSLKYAKEFILTGESGLPPFEIDKNVSLIDEVISKIKEIK